MHDTEDNHGRQKQAADHRRPEPEHRQRTALRHAEEPRNEEHEHHAEQRDQLTGRRSTDICQLRAPLGRKLLRRRRPVARKPELRDRIAQFRGVAQRGLFANRPADRRQRAIGTNALGQLGIVLGTAGRIAEDMTGVIEEAQRFLDISVTRAGLLIVPPHQPAQRGLDVCIGRCPRKSQCFVQRRFHAGSVVRRCAGINDNGLRKLSTAQGLRSEEPAMRGFSRSGCCDLR